MKINSFVGISNNVKLIYKISAVLFIFIYLVFHAFSGENGLRAYFITKNQLKQKIAELSKIEKNLDSIRHDVELLSNNSLDLDLLEERCRIILNYSSPEDIIAKCSSVLNN